MGWRMAQAYWLKFLTNWPVVEHHEQCAGRKSEFPVEYASEVLKQEKGGEKNEIDKDGEIRRRCERGETRETIS
jgi:hypothetical protein